jgi:hypothetical protein
MELAILFADISDSTRLYETLGDAAARAIVTDCLDTMTAVTRRHRGQLARTIGDEVLSTFATPDVAAQAAVDMQEAAGGGTHPVALRIGFHFGPVLFDDGDVHGDAVNIAARVARQAKAGQILTTGAAHGRMTGKWTAAMRQIARAALRGKTGLVDVFEVIWQAQEATFVGQPPWLAATAAARLVVTSGADRIELGEDRRALAVGRDSRNDVVVGEITVSRSHARIEYVNGRFVLTDHSANGTFVQPQDGAVRLVHRDSMELGAAGLLGLGAHPIAGGPATLRYLRA